MIVADKTYTQRTITQLYSTQILCNVTQLPRSAVSPHESATKFYGVINIVLQAVIPAKNTFCSGVNPGEVLGSGPHQLFALPGSAYWWTRAQFSQNISVL